MANEREDTIIRDECADSLSDVPLEFLDCEEMGDITSSEKQSKVESSDDSEIRRRRIQRTLPLPSDTEESDEDISGDWSDFDLPRNNNEFEGSPGPNVFPRDIKNVEDVVELFIGHDLFEFISTETNTGTTIKIPTGGSLIKKVLNLSTLRQSNLENGLGLLFLWES